LDNSNGDVLKKELRKLRKVWVAFVYALLLYIVVCHELAARAPILKDYDLPLEILKYAVFTLSLIAFYLSHHFRKTMMERTSVKSDLKYIEQARKPGKPAVFVKYFTVFIVSVAFTESIALLGVVYFFLSKDYQTLYILVGLSIVAMIYHRPKADELATVSLADEASGRI
jgi:hypothetical protein